MANPLHQMAPSTPEEIADLQRMQKGLGQIRVLTSML